MNPSAPAGAPPRRRSQQERRDTTRAALLDAAIEVLANEGYSNATTGRICEQAGVSRGAHLHHFRTRDGLLFAAIEHLADRLEDRHFPPLAATAPVDEGAGLDILWELFTGRLFIVVLEVITAARTDADLAARLTPLQRRFDTAAMRLCVQLFPSQARHDDFREAMVLVLSAVRGAAILHGTRSSRARRERHWRSVRWQLVSVLQALEPTAGQAAADPRAAS